MKSQQQWFDEYEKNHQHPTNQKIHFVCVPFIYFSIVGLLMCIPIDSLDQVLGWQNPIFDNWAVFAMIPIMVFYIQLSIRTFVLMLLFSISSLYVNHFIGQYVSLSNLSAGIFVLAWVGQFYGHKLEGKKPSFFDDIIYLLVGPAWVFSKITK